MTESTQRSRHTFFRYFAVSPKDRDWGLVVNTVGETHVGPGVAYPVTGHPGGYQFSWSKGRVLAEYQLIHISSGEGLLETKDASVVVHAGDSFLLPPGVWHRYRPEQQTGWHDHWVGFEGDYISRLFNKRIFDSAISPVMMRNEQLVIHLYQSMIDSARTNQVGLQQIIAGATIHLLTLFHASMHKQSGVESPLNKIMGQAMSMLEQPDSKDFSLGQISSRLHVSYSWFRRMFKMHTGMSPHQYRLNLKLCHAKNMLVDTHLTVKEISSRCGFESEQYFCRQFKQQYGDTPTQMRLRFRSAPHVLTGPPTNEQDELARTYKLQRRSL